MSSAIRTTKRSPPSRTTKFKLVMPPGSGSAATGPRQHGRLSAFVFGSMIIECSSDMLAMSDRVESVARATSPGVLGLRPSFQIKSSQCLNDEYEACENPGQHIGRYVTPRTSHPHRDLRCGYGLRPADARLPMI